MLARWKRVVSQRRHDKNVVRRWLTAVENRALMGGWRSWVSFVRDSRNADQMSEVDALRQEMATMKKSAQDTLCKRVVKRMLRVKLGAAWSAWSEHCRLQKLLLRISARWLKQGMVRCVNRWKDWLLQRKLDQKIVRNWLVAVKNRSLTSGWRTWAAFVRSEQKNEQVSEIEALRREMASMKKIQEDKVCRRVIISMLNAKLSAALNAWREFNRLKRLLERVGIRWARQGLVSEHLSCSTKHRAPLCSPEDKKFAA